MIAATRTFSLCSGNMIGCCQKDSNGRVVTTQTESTLYLNPWTELKSLSEQTCCTLRVFLTQSFGSPQFKNHHLHQHRKVTAHLSRDKHLNEEQTNQTPAAPFGILAEIHMQTSPRLRNSTLRLLRVSHSFCIKQKRVKYHTGEQISHTAQPISLWSKVNYNN